MSFTLARLLLIFISLIPQATYTKADAGTLCNKTPFSFKCQNCIARSPNDRTADDNGLAKIVASCAELNTAGLKQTILIAIYGSSHENIIALLRQCVDMVVASRNGYPMLYKLLDDKDYETALKQLNFDINYKLNGCNNLFYATGGLVEMPEEVAPGFTLVNDDIKVVESIIEQLRA